MDGQRPAYRIVETTGPDHDKRFVVEVSVNGRVLATGEGRSQKIAEIQAAEAALAVLRATTLPTTAAAADGTVPGTGVTAPARLLALRLQGFKSFAERTVVEFGPGISAVVGPNGSGKSNLADALRWTLGEQGRALRSRKGEDVIFAGSERRAALGMADVTLVLDNADGLLPVEYSVLELGRRLYRSGENDYLLNKQRVRLRDLVDLLDAAHLADNAFLFIGQGMVDQALALRPEERRPLFEEVAGVRRHERRRRKAEEQLAEAEANLARVDDIVAELRPQARRLAAQAEQQVTRASAGDELAAALVVAAHARWHDAAARHRETADRLARGRADSERAMAALVEAEAEAGAISAALGARADVERDRRAAHEIGPGDADRAPASRGPDRIGPRRHRPGSEPAGRRGAGGRGGPRDPTARGCDGRAGPWRRAGDRPRRGRAVARRGARGARGAARRPPGARGRAGDPPASRGGQGRRDGDGASPAGRGGAPRRRRANAGGPVGAGARRARDAAGRRPERAPRRRPSPRPPAIAAREGARSAADEAEGGRRAAGERATAVGATLAALLGRVQTARARLAEDETRGIARAARRAGGRRVDEDLQVDPALRAAVEAALGEIARAYLVGSAAIPGLAGERGMVVPGDVVDAGPDGSVVTGGSAAVAEDREFRAELERRGGGILSDAVRRDAVGVARRVLGRAAWVVDLPTAVGLQPAIPPGWVVVTSGRGRGGDAAMPSHWVGPRARSSVAPSSSVSRRELARLETEATESERATTLAVEAASRARSALELARLAETQAAAERRAAEEAERVAGRAAEGSARESAWGSAQADRLEAEVARLRAALSDLEAAEMARSAETASGASAPEASALEAWEERVAELRARRDRLASELAVREQVRRDAEAIVARAAAAATYDEQRIARAGSDARALAEREVAVLAERDALTTEVAAATVHEARARAVLDELRSADSADRERLLGPRPPPRPPATTSARRTTGSGGRRSPTSRRGWGSTRSASRCSSSSPGSVRSGSGRSAPWGAPSSGSRSLRPWRWGRRGLTRRQVASRTPSATTRRPSSRRSSRSCSRPGRPGRPPSIRPRRVGWPPSGVAITSSAR